MSEQKELEEDVTAGAGGGEMGVGTGDAAGQFSKSQAKKKGVKRPVVAKQKNFKGMPVFEVDSSDEYHSFSRGVKTFKRWKQHTKSESIRQWANENKGKSFYISHNENYTYIDRSKK